MSQQRYPDNKMMFPVSIPEQWELFADLREELLLNYEYNTARAYWGDLQDCFEWTVKRELNIFKLNEKDIRQYVGLLRRRKYSESTIRRRITTLRLFYNLVIDIDLRDGNPAEPVVIRRRKK